MNIFLILLSVLFMGGYYIISSPSQRIAKHETEFAIKKADLRSIAECVVSAQNAAMYGEQFEDPCIKRYDVTSQYVCMNKTYNIVPCDASGSKEPDYNFIITATSELPSDEYNSMLEILEQYYPDAGTFGVFISPSIMSAGSISNREIPKKVIETAKLTDGQLVYLMQYKIPEKTIDYPVVDGSDLVCPPGTMKTFRFGRWQCIGYNYKISCTGDTIWDSRLQDCVADESRKPLCANNQTAVMVEDVWECMDPISDKTCADGMIARLNYNTLEWECVNDPNATKTKKKCEHFARAPRQQGSIGATMRVRSISCTDCEKLVIDEDTCENYCAPDPEKLNDASCYAGDISECTGSTRGIYFGFASKSRIDGIAALSDIDVILDKQHSQNRKFNCIDCGTGEIDKEKSIFPYTAVCK